MHTDIFCNLTVILLAIICILVDTSNPASKCRALCDCSSLQFHKLKIAPLEAMGLVCIKKDNEYPLVQKIIKDKYIHDKQLLYAEK